MTSVHVPARRILQDGRHLHPSQRHDRRNRVSRERHADRYLKPPDEMARLFSRYPDALARTIEIAQRCCFSLDELAYNIRKRHDPA